MTAGFLKPDEGQVIFNGYSIGGMKPHKICQLGMVRTFQITQPFAGLSTLENIMVGAYTDQHDGRRRPAKGPKRSPKLSA